MPNAIVPVAAAPRPRALCTCVPSVRVISYLQIDGRNQVKQARESYASRAGFVHTCMRTLHSLESYLCRLCQGACQGEKCGCALRRQEVCGRSGERKRKGARGERKGARGGEVVVDKRQWLRQTVARPKKPAAGGVGSPSTRPAAVRRTRRGGGRRRSTARAPRPRGRGRACREGGRRSCRCLRGWPCAPARATAGTPRRRAP
mmetsp:Transcript_44191/g.142000  ORF Transcript_44191/g.142000 Transcript_44191/m.142000 type:complete len:203 (+) Transcript_44191:731-1339(+)